jgi:hypothetical protein
MAQEPSSFQFKDIPLEDARRMGRGPRMEPMLYDTLHTKSQSVMDQAARVRFGPEIRPARMKAYILRIARELGVPVTVRTVPGGLLFWRSTDDDIQQAEEMAQQLPSAQRKSTARPRGRRRRA